MMSATLAVNIDANRGRMLFPLTLSDEVQPAIFSG
jgi:hypothetical protein